MDTLDKRINSLKYLFNYLVKLGLLPKNTNIDYNELMKDLYHLNLLIYQSYLILKDSISDENKVRKLVKLKDRSGKKFIDKKLANLIVKKIGINIVNLYDRIAEKSKNTKLKSLDSVKKYKKTIIEKLLKELDKETENIETLKDIKKTYKKQKGGFSLDSLKNSFGDITNVVNQFKSEYNRVNANQPNNNAQYGQPGFSGSYNQTFRPNMPQYGQPGFSGSYNQTFRPNMPQYGQPVPINNIPQYGQHYLTNNYPQDYSGYMNEEITEKINRYNDDPFFKDNIFTKLISKPETIEMLANIIAKTPLKSYLIDDEGEQTTTCKSQSPIDVVLNTLTFFGHSVYYGAKGVKKTVEFMFDFLFHPIYALEQIPVIGGIVGIPLDLIGVVLDTIDILLGFLGPILSLVVSVVPDVVSIIPAVGSVSASISVVADLIEPIASYLIEDGIDLISMILNIARKQWGLAYVNALDAIPGLDNIMDTAITYMYTINRFMGRLNKFTGIIAENADIIVPFASDILENPELLSLDNIVVHFVIPNKERIPLIKYIPQDLLLAHYKKVLIPIQFLSNFGIFGIIKNIIGFATSSNVVTNELTEGISNVPTKLFGFMKNLNIFDVDNPLVKGFNKEKFDLLGLISPSGKQINLSQLEKNMPSRGEVSKKTRQILTNYKKNKASFSETSEIEDIYKGGLRRKTNKNT